MNIINDDNILVCEITYSEININDNIELIKDSDNEKLSWTNLPDVVNMYIDYKIKFVSVYGGFHNDKWIFNIYHEINEQTQTEIIGYKILLNILVNDEEKEALCEVISYSCLKCVSNHADQNKNDIILINGNTEPNLGYIYFTQNLSSEQKVVSPLNLYINFNSIQKSLVGENLEKLEIKGKLSNSIDYSIEKDTLTKIEILIIENDERETKEIDCLTSHINREKGSEVILYCEFNILNNKRYEINIDENGFSKNVHFNLVNNIKINEDEEKQDSTKETESNSIKNQEENKTSEIEKKTTEKENKTTETEKKTTETENKTTETENKTNEKENDNIDDKDNNNDGKDEFNSDNIEEDLNNDLFIKSYRNNIGLLIIHLFFIMSLFG